MFILIGSNAVRMVSLNNDLRSFSRKADVRIELLQDVIERVGKGEKVDVKKMLGSGDEDKEQEWENVVKEIEHVDQMWETKAKRRGEKRDQKQSLEQDVHNETEKKEMDSEVTYTKPKADDQDPVNTSKEARGRVVGNPPPAFY
ncbi:hypothetical protein MMC07_002401 [Pseudocyphellaria aurata]|nr:hypothetical protein [Pseudocyphellaria aurata]